MHAPFNPSRLDLARRRRGYSSSELAKAVGVSTRMVVAYERGEYEPGRRNLAKMAEVLRFPEEFFSGPDLDEPPLEGSSFRALTTLTARDRHQGLAAGALALALSDWIDARFVLPEPSIPQYQGVDPEMAATAVRGEWGLGEQPTQNMIHLLESHGVRVFSLAQDCAALDAFSFWRGQRPYVFLNTTKSAERSRMDAAHELGHLVLHWKGGMRGQKWEREADLFGSAFLMPRGSILAEAPRGGRIDHILKAKYRWRVSAANLTHRMHVLGLLTDWQYRALFVEMSKRGYRNGEPDGIDAESSQVLAKVFKAMRDEGVSQADVARDLMLVPDELENIVFGLVLTALDGSSSRADSAPKNRPMLRLL